MAQSRLKRSVVGVVDPRQLPLPGLFSSDPLNTSYLLGELDLNLIDLPVDFGRIRMNKRHVNAISDRWDLAFCDPIRVMYVPETKRYQLVDGVHRFHAAKKNGATALPARVERNVSVERAADIFVVRATAVRGISPADKFRNNVVAGHKEAIEVRDILESFGLYVFVDPERTATAKIHVPSIAAIRHIHARLGNPELIEILTCVDQAWGLRAAGALGREVLLGAEEFWARYHERFFDRAVLVTHLKKIDPLTVVRQADQLRGASRGRMKQTDAISQVLRDLYNHGRKTESRLD